MTDFNRIKDYYRYFDEKNRLVNSCSGRLEYMMSMEILNNYLPENGTVLDLGGGAGAYSFPLSEKGYKVYLADLSEELIQQAKEQNQGIKNPIICNVVNATDLSLYNDGQFDAVLLMGPLYHLLEASERQKCVLEVNRVLKPGGIVFAAFIPYLSGSIGVVDRFFNHPNQVDSGNLKQVFQSGKFSNLLDIGFQEGYYPTLEEVDELFGENGFTKELVRSVRGFGYGREDSIFRMEEEAPEMFETVINMLNETAVNKSVIDMCGHAVYVGKKCLEPLDN